MSFFSSWSDIASNMFELHDITFAEKVFRPILVYLFLIIGLRLAGKRELAQINPLDLVVLLVLSNTVQNAIIGLDNSVTGGVIGAGTLFIVNYLLNWVANRNRAIDELVNGEPVSLIVDGEVQIENLRKQMISEKELRVVCMEQGVRRFEEIEIARLETSGAITVFLKHPTIEERKFELLNERLERIETLLQAKIAS